MQLVQPEPVLILLTATNCCLWESYAYVRAADMQVVNQGMSNYASNAETVTAALSCALRLSQYKLIDRASRITQLYFSFCLFRRVCC
jgi:hypothetical protein